MNHGTCSSFGLQKRWTSYDRTLRWLVGIHQEKKKACRCKACRHGPEKIKRDYRNGYIVVSGSILSWPPLLISPSFVKTNLTKNFRSHRIFQRTLVHAFLQLWNGHESCHSRYSCQRHKGDHTCHLDGLVHDISLLETSLTTCALKQPAHKGAISSYLNVVRPMLASLWNVITHVRSCCANRLPRRLPELLVRIT